MSIQDLASSLLGSIQQSADRPLAESILAVPAETWFPNGPPESREETTGLKKAAAGLGAMLVSGPGEITPPQLSGALGLWHLMHGTSWCPPFKEVVDAL